MQEDAVDRLVNDLAYDSFMIMALYKFTYLLTYLLISEW